MVHKSIKIKREVTEQHKFCDSCGIEIPMGLACSEARCQICQNDLCENCIGMEKETSGDYRDVWCKACWRIGEKYRPKIKELDDEIKKLYDAWYKEC